MLIHCFPTSEYQPDPNYAEWVDQSTHIACGYPVSDMTNGNFTCNRGAFTSAARTGTAIVKAGTEVGFHIGVDPPVSTLMSSLDKALTVPLGPRG